MAFQRIITSHVWCYCFAHVVLMVNTNCAEH